MNISSRNTDGNIAEEGDSQFEWGKVMMLLPLGRCTMNRRRVVEGLWRSHLRGIKNKGHGERRLGRDSIPGMQKMDGGQKECAGLTVTRLCKTH